MYRHITLTCLLLAALTACAPATPSFFVPTRTSDLSAVSTPTSTLEPVSASLTPEIVSPTPPPLEATSTPSPPPTDTAMPSTPLPSLAPPTLQPTSIPQPEAGSAAIQFYSPGPLSRVTSPVVFYGYAIPGYNSKGVIELIGEDGSLLASELLQLNTFYKWAYFYWTLPFQARGAGELARLTLTTRDEHGRPTAVQSVHLILLPDGFEVINPPGDLSERCVIESPAAGKRVSGGTVSVSGEMRPYNSLPLIVELVAGDGSVLASQLVPIQPNYGYYVPFQVTLTYSVSEYTPVLLTISQPDERIGGTMYLYSQEINLNP